jgi:hypothetical protein
MRLAMLAMAMAMMTGTAATAQTYDCAQTFLCAPQYYDVTDVVCRARVGDGTVGALSVTVNEDGTARFDYAFDPDVQSFVATVTEGDGLRILTGDDPDGTRILHLHFTGQAMMTLTWDFGGNFGATVIYYQCTRR